MNQPNPDTDAFGIWSQHDQAWLTDGYSPLTRKQAEAERAHIIAGAHADAGDAGAATAAADMQVRRWSAEDFANAAGETVMVFAGKLVSTDDARTIANAVHNALSMRAHV